MTTGRMTVEERIEMLKLIKVLAAKAVQIIIQSRKGDKIKTKCNQNHSNTLSLTARELVDMDESINHAIGIADSRDWSPVCIEIFLKTADGDVMMLETWTISLIGENSNGFKSFSLYSRLGLLLKSLISITRVVPAYRYAQKQNPDSYIISHKVYNGEAQINLLGDKYKQLRIGSVATPIGALTLDLSYRTVMTISPQPSGIETNIMVKSDHFRPEFGIKNTQQNEDNSASFSDESSYKVGAFVESRHSSVQDSDQLIPAVPFGSLLLAKTHQSPPLSPVTSTTTFTNTAITVAAAESPRRHTKSSPIDIKRPAGFNVTNVFNGNITPGKSSCSNDDFIMVDFVKHPFAETTGNVELGVFYQEWQTAPPLQTCPDDPPVIEQVGDLTTQLANYESNMKEFDSMITSLCIGNENNLEEETLS